MSASDLRRRTGSGGAHAGARYRSDRRLGRGAGGVETAVPGLPADFPAAVFVVIHISPNSHSVLPELLTRAGKLPACHPAEGDAITPGHIYVAPPDRHLLVQEGRVLLRRGPQENRTRPAVDPLFRSAAVAYRSRVIGLVLSGLLDDGAAGLAAVKACGGLCLVQAPDDAIWPEMPRNALRRDHVDYCEPVSALPLLLSRLVQEPAGPAPPVPRNLFVEASIAAQETAMAVELEQLGRPSRLSCPQCGGVAERDQRSGIHPLSLPGWPCLHRRGAAGGAER